MDRGYEQRGCACEIIIRKELGGHILGVGKCVCARCHKVYALSLTRAGEMNSERGERER